MNFQIVALLGQDGITNGAIYALLSLSIILVFTVTRILLIPLGEFVTYGALTMAAFQNGYSTQAGWLLAAMLTAAALLNTRAALIRKTVSFPWFRILSAPAYGLLMLLILHFIHPEILPMYLQALLTLALLVPLGPTMYRVFFQPVADAPPLVLLIISIAIHVAMVATGLLLFGPDGGRTESFTGSGFMLGNIMMKSQTIWVLLVSVALIIALFVVFERTLYGKALRATAVNRTGARLMGISPEFAGGITFTVAAFIGVLSGILIAPITTLYFDTGFIISLKGFVGAIIGGLISYPLAAMGAIAVGLIEAFSMFWASAYKEIIVFVLIIPFLIWRSLNSSNLEDEA